MNELLLCEVQNLISKMRTLLRLKHDGSHGILLKKKSIKLRQIEEYLLLIG